MARKTNLSLTPIMSLAVLALFAMMIPLYTMVNSQSGKTQTSNAASLATPRATVTPNSMIEY